jgi:hypothetical protein
MQNCIPLHSDRVARADLTQYGSHHSSPVLEGAIALHDAYRKKHLGSRMPISLTLAQFVSILAAAILPHGFVLGVDYKEIHAMGLRTGLAKTGYVPTGNVDDIGAMQRL